jgi:hypothetical protein
MDLIIDVVSPVLLAPSEAVHFSPDATSSALRVPEGQELMKQLLGQGRGELHVTWAGLFSTALHVETTSCSCSTPTGSWRRSWQGGCKSTRSSWGTVSCSSPRSERGRASPSSSFHTPHLDRRFSQRHELRMSSTEYRRAWQGLIAEVYSLNHGHR